MPRLPLAMLVPVLALALVAPAPARAAAEPPEPFVLEGTTVAQIKAGLASGAVTCGQLVRGHLERIARYDDAGPTLNSLIAVAPDAVERARALDAAYRESGPVGELHCVPVVLKDNIETAGLASTAGSSALAGSPPAQDAFLTERLLEAGAVVIAKGNLDEWAHGGRAGYSSAGGQTTNPLDPELSPGGSSGGPAVAVAADLGVIAVGSDTLGSIRGPVNQNSLAGVKPTRGLVSGTGVVPFSLTFDVAGPMTRTVSDSALALNALAAVDPADPRTLASLGRVPRDYTEFLDPAALDGVRVGVLRTYASDDPAFDAAVARVEALGAEVVDDLEAPPSVLDLSADFYQVISETEFKAQLGDYLQTRRPDAAVQTHADVLAASAAPGFPIAPEVLVRLQREATRGTLTDPAYLAALAAPQAMRDGIDQLLADNDVDVLLKDSGGSQLASFSGYPEVLVPAGTTAGGDPYSVAFLGRAFQEGPLLGSAFAFEQATRARLVPTSTPPLESLPRFTDTAGDNHDDSIDVLARAGVLQGYADETFRPGLPVSRGQAAAYLARGLGLQPQGGPPVPDAAGAFADAVQAVVDAGIATGYPDGTYRPGQPVTRGQAASLLARALELPPGPASCGVSDLAAAGVHAAAVCAVVAAGLAEGFPDGSYGAGLPISRGQLATVLARALGLSPAV